MEMAAGAGIPGALALLLFFCIPAARLWPIARERLTDDNRWDVAIATSTVLSVVGFVVAGQFVSVSGLETPYYVVMIGVALLKARSREDTARAVEPASPRAPAFQPPAARTPPMPVPLRQPPRATGRILALPGTSGSVKRS
jgi:hypothetical protein